MKLNISTKLYAGFGIVIVGLVVAGAFALMQLGSVGGKAEQLFDENLSTETKTGIMRRDILLMREQILQYPLAPAERRGEVSVAMAQLESAIATELADLRAQPGLTDSQKTELD
ncbi:MAG: MCP four helix bundle domain-containing protein, partial [SAR202 cluster bacterium]|nr:MCP four helix bundle domain-containing protein [SAR202 cluster bacterium]